jgi:hypothetical protein
MKPKKKNLSLLLKYVEHRWRLYWAEQRELRFLRKKVRNRREAIKQADLRHKADGKRYWVLEGVKPGTFWVGNNQDIKIGKKIGVFNKKVQHHNLLEEAVYFTK